MISAMAIAPSISIMEKPLSERRLKCIGTRSSGSARRWVRVLFLRVMPTMVASLPVITKRPLNRCVDCYVAQVRFVMLAEAACAGRL